MRFKIDENLPQEVSEAFRDAGHDAISVYDERLVGANDVQLLRVCTQEQRIVITFDTDFASVLLLRQYNACGAIVLRLARQDKLHVLVAIQQLLPLLDDLSPSNNILIVEEDEIRIRNIFD